MSSGRDFGVSSILGTVNFISIIINIKPINISAEQVPLFICKLGVPSLGFQAP